MLNGRKSFTLVECVLSIVVVSVGIVGILGMWGTALRANRTAADETRATMLAREKLADVILGGIDELGESVGTFGPPNERFRSYVCTSEIEESGLVEVTVAIYWNDAQGERSVCTCLLLHSDRSTPPGPPF